MPCQHLTEIKDLKLPVSDADVLKVLCPVCGQIDVCAYTPVNVDQDDPQPLEHPAEQKSAVAEKP